MKFIKEENLKFMNERLEKLLEVLSKIKKEEIRSLELLDPQFKAIKKIYEKIGEKSIFYSFLNSLVSFMLNGSGEEYWMEFSEKISFSNDEINDVKNFLKVSNYNKRFLEVKIKRLEKISEKWKNVKEILLSLDLENIWKKSFEILGIDKFSKTACFATKMCYYSIINFKEVEAPFSIPIPFDSRIQKITEMIIGSEVNRKYAINFWFKVSEIVKIPCIQIDTILWLSFNPKNYSLLNEKFKKVAELLNLWKQRK